MGGNVKMQNFQRWLERGDRALDNNRLRRAIEMAAGMPCGATPADLWAQCQEPNQLLWMAMHAGVSLGDLWRAVFPTARRVVRVYAADACEAHGLEGMANKLRSLPEDTTLQGYSEALSEAARAAAAPLNRDCLVKLLHWPCHPGQPRDDRERILGPGGWYISARAASPHGRADEDARCADDVRSVLGNPPPWLDAVCGAAA